MAHKGYVYRIYPDERQEAVIRQTIGSCRYIYNKALEWRMAAYDADGTTIPYDVLAKALPQLKRHALPWLKEADSVALQQSLRDLMQAFGNFFEGRAGFPEFKAKNKSRWSYRTMNNNNVMKAGDGYVVLPRLGKVRAATPRPVPEGWRAKHATVTLERDGTFYASICYEYDEDISSPELDIEKAIGLDYKSDGLYVDSDGHTCGSPRYYREAEARIKKEQRKLSHMIESHVIGYKKGDKGGRVPVYDRPLRECRNIDKQRRKLAKAHRKAADKRKDHLHKESTRIANSCSLVGAEDLDMRAMANRGFGNGKATLDNGYGMFTRMLKYKMHDRGKPFVRIDRWYPSSQTCSACGFRDRRLKDLRIREWECPNCGAVHDRDHNAARCVKRAALDIYFNGPMAG